jgi:hypothetical protein
MVKRILVLMLLVLSGLSFSGWIRAAGENGKEATLDFNGQKESKPPKTLLQWQVGQDDAEVEDDEEEDTIPTDRPDFTENSRNVGRGRIQLESGYTYFQDRSKGVFTRQHSYPEVLVRIGLFADWFEFRIGQNFLSETQKSSADNLKASGGEDLYLGIGLGLTEQKGIFPESRIVLQTRVPTGSSAFSDNEMLPGFNFLYGWDVVKDKLTFAGSTQVNRRRDGSDHYYAEFAQALTSGISFTDKLGMYLEWFCLVPTGGIDPDLGPEHYFDGGFVYQFTPNFQVDIRAGVGLNRHAQDFFTGSGFAVRY